MALPRKVRHVGNNLGILRARAAANISTHVRTFVGSTDRRSRCNIHGALRESLCLRIFHPPSPTVRRGSPLSPGTFPPFVDDFSSRCCLRGRRNSRDPTDRRDRSVLPRRGGRSSRSERRPGGKKVEPLGRSRSYESYASVSAADRIKNLGKKEPVRPRVRESSVPPSFPFLERCPASLSTLCPLFLCET